MRIGFTGSSRTVQVEQRVELGSLLKKLYRQGRPFGSVWLHHGDCMMADEHAAEIARRLGYKIHCHPPINNRRRAWADGDAFEAPLPYLDRNRAIVRASNELIAMPDTMSERIRSGTWATVRYAREVGTKITILWPNGTVKIEGARPCR